MGPLVSTGWLAAHIADPELIVLDATLPPVGVVPAPEVHARYLREHLPGAIFFDIEALSDPDTSLPHMLPAPERFAAAMAALGVASDATLVVYEQEGVFAAPRARWMLRTLGAATVYVLDGGLRAWQAAGLPVASGPVARPPARFTARRNAAAVADYAALEEQLHTHGMVLDARPAGRFTGSAPEPRPGIPSGHMPGARSVPLAELVTEGRLKSPAELAPVFAEKGIDLAQPIVTTCGSGITAAALALALELCGASDVRLYDGSWAEYATHPEFPIVRGEPEKPTEEDACSTTGS